MKEYVKELQKKTNGICMWAANGYHDGEYEIGIRTDDVIVMKGDCPLISGTVMRDWIPVKELNSINDTCQCYLKSDCLIGDAWVSILLGVYRISDVYHNGDRVYFTVWRESK